MMLKARSGWPRWLIRGSVATAMKAKEATSEKRPIGQSSLRPKTW